MQTETAYDQPEEKHFFSSCFEWMEALITALIAVLIISVFVFRLNIQVVGPSMMPNYNNGDRVLVSCLDRNFKTGDVIVTDKEGTSLNESLIKRVIATQGQVVNINFKAGVVSVDGVQLDESSYIQNGITTTQDDVSFPQTVPEDCVFVLGDNRTISEDSRYAAVGMINTHHVIGKVIFKIYPFQGHLF